jgi:hypothetical protein
MHSFQERVCVCVCVCQCRRDERILAALLPAVAPGSFQPAPRVLAAWHRFLKFSNKTNRYCSAMYCL